MTIDIKSLVRDNILALKPYQSARGIHQAGEHILLDANENAYSPDKQRNLNRYPDPLQREVKKKLAKLKKVKPEQIFLSNGSDEAIDYIIRVFCQPQKDKIVIMPPTFGMYKVAAAVNDVPLVEIPLNNEYQIDLEAFRKADLKAVKLLFLCSPNNPTGNLLDSVAIKEILTDFKGIVVIDEAYIDFAPEHSFLKELKNHNNLIITQTASKAWGSAAIRFGMTYASPEIIHYLNTVKLPYNLSLLTQEVVSGFIDHQYQQFIANVDVLLSSRKSLEVKLKSFSFVKKIFPSATNFIMLAVSDASKLCDHLFTNGVLVRNVSNNRNCEGCLRISVGTDEENTKLIDLLNNY